MVTSKILYNLSKTWPTHWTSSMENDVGFHLPKTDGTIIFIALFYSNIPSPLAEQSNSFAYKKCTMESQFPSFAVQPQCHAKLFVLVRLGLPFHTHTFITVHIVFTLNLGSSLCSLLAKSLPTMWQVLKNLTTSSEKDNVLWWRYKLLTPQKTSGDLFRLDMWFCIPYGQETPYQSCLLTPAFKCDIAKVHLDKNKVSVKACQPAPVPA